MENKEFVGYLNSFGVCVYDHSAFHYIQLLSFETCPRHLYPQDTVHIRGSRLKTEDENKQPQKQFLCCVDHRYYF
ncbi:UNVERIFIED_CONTAM: hypothetical protein NCL1_39074 [Trichonephila clavipes]